MKKRLIFLVMVIFLVVVSISFAQDEFDLNKAYEWLNGTMVDSSWNKDIDELSLSLVALNRGGYKIDAGLAKLIDEQDSDYSWNDNVKDTAFAILALDELGEDIDDEVEWLKGAQIVTQVSGDWLIQINAKSGSCDVYYNGGVDKKTFTIANEKITSCNNDYWINIKGCIKADLSAYETFEVNCADIGAVDISLLYREGDKYYIIQQNNDVVKAGLTIQNGCFGTREHSGSCDYESTAYATWILEEVGEEDGVYTKGYLGSNIRGTVEDYALLYLITGDTKHDQWLKDRQLLSGSWDSNVFKTALATLALRTYGGNTETTDSSKEWLENQQKEDGSWNRDVMDTSMTIYGAFTDRRQRIPDACNYNGTCDLGEDCYNCQEDCGNCSTTGYCGDNVVDFGEDCDATYDTDGTLLDGSDSNCLGLCDDFCMCPSSGSYCGDGIVDADEDCEYDYNCGYDEECNVDCECVSSTQSEDCNYDDICDYPLEDCTCVDCYDDPSCESAEDCNYDGYCDELVENCDCDDCSDEPECLGDTGCGSDFDCFEGEYCDIATGECLDKPGFPMWIIILLIVLVVGAGGYFAYIKFFKGGGFKGFGSLFGGKKKKVSFQEYLKKRQEQLSTGTAKPSGAKPAVKRPLSRPMPARRTGGSYKDHKLERELDESIKKAKELLGKKT